MYVVDADWLGTTVEEALEPELEIVDPHHHLWEHETMTRYLVDDLLADTGSGHRVVQTVFVECGWAYRPDAPSHLRTVGETEFVAAQAAESARRDGAEIAGIVSTCDLRLDRGLLDEALDAHEAAGGGRFRGIRHRVAHDPTGSAPSSRAAATPGGLMADPDFRRGVARLGERGLAFDAWLYHPQLPELTALAHAAPDTTVVLDHVGGPLGVGAYAGKAAESRAFAREQWPALAACPNVVVKVGGIGMAIYGDGWGDRPRAPSSDDLVAVWGDDLRAVIDAFGPSRCLFESNFPVDKQGCSYAVLWNAFKKVSAGYDAGERADLFAGTARRAYRLPEA
jgi:predicted TIM-barrel fold metal-dependent hydrolase